MINAIEDLCEVRNSFAAIYFDSDKRRYLTGVC
jgi:hypothetical protein